MATILVGERELQFEAAQAEGDDLWVPREAAALALGWEAKPEGLCRADTCVPTPPGREGEFLRPGALNVAALWRHLGRPVLRDEAGAVWCLGDGAAERRAGLASLEAPDFALPDWQGRPHRLSHYRGRKVLLATWASW